MLPVSGARAARRKSRATSGATAIEGFPWVVGIGISNKILLVCAMTVPPPNAVAASRQTRSGVGVLANIGASLRARRRQLGLGIADVARGSQLSNGYISLLERNLASPSLTALMRIGEVLGLPLEYFLQMPHATGHHFPKRARTVFELERGGMTFDRISGEFPSSDVNAMIVTIPPGHKSTPVTHPGEELIYVMTGRIRFTLGGKRLALEPGDSVHLPSTTPHGWENPFAKAAKVMWMGTVPLFHSDAADLGVGPELSAHGSPMGLPVQLEKPRKAKHAS